jgi:hypothetical protein
MGLGQGDVTFWTCPNKNHTAVRAEGAVKVCETCGITSAATEALIEMGQADQRQRDLLFLRTLARRIRAAREVILAGDATGKDLPAVPPIPAMCVDQLAAVLAGAPVGALPGE